MTVDSNTTVVRERAAHTDRYYAIVDEATQTAETLDLAAHVDARGDAYLDRLEAVLTEGLAVTRCPDARVAMVIALDRLQEHRQMDALEDERVYGEVPPRQALIVLTGREGIGALEASRPGGGR